MIGRILDKYEVMQKIGEGGMATVYLGRHITLQRDVAIKVLHPHLSASARNRSRFAREAQTIETLRHDNILEIFDYSGDTSDECYIITEYVEGETLHQLLKRCEHIPSEVVCLIGIQLAKALDYAHVSGVLHRDLKPENVMIRADGRVKLMDFGIARFLNESQITLTGALVGSPAFMSPEQATESTLDQRSDLFSLGTLLYYLVSGQLPFPGTNPSITLKKIIEGEREDICERVPSISPSLGDVIEHLLQTHADDRPRQATDVLSTLVRSSEELNIDFNSETYSLSRFVQDPTSYSRDLDQLVLKRLLEKGKHELDHDEPLLALRHFNRLLCINEDNPEVLALIQGLHRPPEPTQREVRPFLFLIGFALILVISWQLFPAQSAPPPSPIRISVPAPKTAPTQNNAPTPAPTKASLPVPHPPALKVRRLSKKAIKTNKITQSPPPSFLLKRLPRSTSDRRWSIFECGAPTGRTSLRMIKKSATRATLVLFNSRPGLISFTCALR